MAEPDAETRVAELYACACGMLKLFLTGGEPEAAKAAAFLVLHLHPPEAVRQRILAEKGWPLLESDVAAQMHALAESVLRGRTREISH